MDPYKMVIACTNQKGGCAKTTTAVNVATALAEGDPKNGIAPSKVLLVDLDPQGSASTSFGINKSTLDRTVYDLLMNDLGEDLPVLEEYLMSPEIITDHMRQTWKSQNMDKKRYPKRLKVENLWLLPSNIQLSGAEIELATRIGRETRLKEGLAGAIEEFDYIIIDTPPSLGLLTINALTAANWVLIPVQTEYYALEGMSQLMNSIKLIQKRINPHLKLFGIALTMYQKTRLCNTVSSEVRKHFAEHTFATMIPRIISIAEAPLDGAPVVLLKNPNRSNKGSQAYWALTREVSQRVTSLRQKYGVREVSRLKLHNLGVGE
uniref:Cobyrinic acid a,c-diamide synthase (ParA, soj) n=1 Tax=uncultured marine group II/III euryarchaeote KM3_88_H06 TaxID=1456537 RepID=A0A075I022_9EURY|nr:Cobyrinic acid a,c-diamide synthase (parA, soj) [uncultured marine group II/III euryarchaeote KM3_88_H06]